MKVAAFRGSFQVWVRRRSVENVSPFWECLVELNTNFSIHKQWMGNSKVVVHVNLKCVKIFLDLKGANRNMKICKFRPANRRPFVFLILIRIVCYLRSYSYLMVCPRTGRSREDMDFALAILGRFVLCHPDIMDVRERPSCLTPTHSIPFKPRSRVGGSSQTITSTLRLYSQADSLCSFLAGWSLP